MSYPTDKELEGKYLDESSLTTIKHLAIPRTTEEKNKCYQDFDITWLYQSEMFYDNIANGSFTGIYPGCSFTAKDADGTLYRIRILELDRYYYGCSENLNRPTEVLTDETMLTSTAYINHHIVCTLDSGMTWSSMRGFATNDLSGTTFNSTNSVSTGYYGSGLRSWINTTLIKIITEMFQTHLLTVLIRCSTSAPASGYQNPASYTWSPEKVFVPCIEDFVYQYPILATQSGMVEPSIQGVSDERINESASYEPFAAVKYNSFLTQQATFGLNGSTVYSATQEYWVRNLASNKIADNSATPAVTYGGGSLEMYESRDNDKFNIRSKNLVAANTRAGVYPIFVLGTENKTYDRA